MKKQHTKFIGALFTVIALVVAMLPTTLMAAPTTGTLIIHKYSMTDVSQATTPGTGQEITDPSQLPAGAKPLSGVTFKIYSVVVDATTATQGAYPASGTITPDNAANPTSITDSEGTTFAVAALTSPNAALSNTGVTTDANGAATAGPIPQGIYLVIEQTPDSTSGITAPSAPFVVAVPMANAEGTDWINPVNVYPKNEMLAVTKSVDTTSVAIGDSVAYTIDAGVPSTLSDITTYNVNDTLDDSLNFDSITEPIVATASDGTTTIDVPSDQNLYTITPSAAATGGGANVVVSFNQDGVNWLATNNIRSVAVVLNATVNNTLATQITAVNAATASFVDKNNHETVTNPSNEVDIHTGTIQVTKVNARGGATLSGAVFKVASSLTNAQNNNFLREDSAGNVLDTTDTGYADATDITITTGDNGVGTVSGLADMSSDTAATYWISETQAPAGYNILVNPVEVSFTGASSTNNWTAAVTVNNSSGFTLPLTGAAGIALFSMIGVILVGLAILLTANMRKKRRKLAGQIGV